MKFQKNKIFIFFEISEVMHGMTKLLIVQW